MPKTYNKIKRNVNGLFAEKKFRGSTLKSNAENRLLSELSKFPGTLPILWDGPWFIGVWTLKIWWIKAVGLNEL